MPNRLVSEIPAGPPGDGIGPGEKRGNGDQWDTLRLVR
jgi:hypothetical protein